MTIHGYNVSEEPPFIIYEFMEGGSLEQYITSQSRSTNKFQPSKKWVAPRLLSFPWICDLLRALAYLHEGAARIIHRDLKPANLMLTRDQRVLKIADFGLSRKMGQDSDGRRMSGGTGTLRYMAPEMYRKDPVYTEKVDVFSTAIIMFLLTMGQPAYSGEVSRRV